MFQKEKTRGSCAVDTHTFIHTPEQEFLTLTVLLIGNILVAGVHRCSDVFLRVHRLRYYSDHRRRGDKPEEEHPPRYSRLVNHNTHRLCHHQHDADADR